VTDGPAAGARRPGTRIVEIRQGILKKNDELARRLRERFRERGVFVLSLVSSPGAGKTALLEQTLRRVTADARLRAAALVGDLATDNDAARLARSGAPVRQIVTGTVCHLDAQMIESALAVWDPGPVDLLCIENVGNLVCPASYDLGEDLRAVLFSVTEGEDKPLKYPPIFDSADVAVVTKTDLSSAAEFDRDTALANMRRIRPGLPIFEVSARTGDGLNEWLTFVLSAVENKRRGTPDPGRAGPAAGARPAPVS
jgi:hydrogenase nickel incorporation protein HypB